MLILLSVLLKISGKRKVVKSRFEAKGGYKKGLIPLLLSYAKGNTKLFIIDFSFNLSLSSDDLSIISASLKQPSNT